MKPIKNNLIIELHVPDFVKVKNFYSKLGFKILSEDPIGEQLGYLVMERVDGLGRTLINFYGGDKRVVGHSFFKDFSRETKPGYEVEITIPVENLEELYKKIPNELRSRVRQELMFKRWNKKDFRIEDPFGFYLRFTELVDWGQ